MVAFFVERWSFIQDHGQQPVFRADPMPALSGSLWLAESITPWHRSSSTVPSRLLAQSRRSRSYAITLSSISGKCSTGIRSAPYSLQCPAPGAPRPRTRPRRPARRAPARSPRHAGHLLDQHRHVIDRDLFRVPDVEDLPIRLRMRNQGQHGAHHAAHLGERSALGAVAVDRGGLPSRGQPHEAWDHHAARAGLMSLAEYVRGHVRS